MSTEFRTKEYTTAEVMLMVAQTQFRGFTQRDGYAWAGCESESPQIGEFRHPDGRVTTIVIDGASLNLLDSTDDQCDVHEGRMYELADKNG